MTYMFLLSFIVFEENDRVPHLITAVRICTVLFIVYCISLDIWQLHDRRLSDQ